MDRKTLRLIGIFTVVVLVSGWVGVLVDSVLTDQPEGDSLGMAVWLLLPVVATILMIILAKISLKEMGFLPRLRGNIKWYATSLFVFPVVTCVSLLVGVAAKWVDLSSLNPGLFLAAFGAGLLAQFIKNIFEETLWRGFLASRLLKSRLNDWMIYLFVGLVWGLWHAPYYMVFLSQADMAAVLPASRVVFLVIAVVTILGWSVPYVELYRLSGSIWPCVLMHSVEDAFVNPLVISGFVGIAAGRELLVSPVLGLFNLALYILVGLAIRAYRIHRVAAASGQALSA